MEKDDASEDSSEERGFENVGQSIRAFSIMARQSSLARASAAVSGGALGRISIKATVEPENQLMRPASGSFSPAGRSTVILGPNDYVNPNMGSDGDMSTRRKALENAEAQKMTRWIQAGILTNDWTPFAAEAPPRKDRHPRRSIHNGGSHQVDPLSTFFQTDHVELMPPSLSLLKERVQRRELGNDSILAAFPISTNTLGSVSRATEQSVLSEFDGLVEMTSVAESPKKSTERQALKLPFKKRLLINTNSLDEPTHPSADTETTDVPTDSSFLKDTFRTPKQNALTLPSVPKVCMNAAQMKTRVDMLKADLKRISNPVVSVLQAFHNRQFNFTKKTAND
ncbi:hypothetical protein SprV_0401415800 [Sparganum proliferum]